MSEITTFANDKVRVAADLLAQLDNYSATVIAEWNARPEVHPPNDSTLIDDGSGDSGDGRPQGTGARVTNIITRLMDYQTVMGAPGVRDTVLQMAVNTTR